MSGYNLGDTGGGEATMDSKAARNGATATDNPCVAEHHGVWGGYPMLASRFGVVAEVRFELTTKGV
jgi:hypothetical protein